MPNDLLTLLGPAADFLRDLLQTSSHGVAVVDRNLRYVALNTRHADANARPLTEHLGVSVDQVAPSLAFPLHRLLKDVFDTGQPALGRRLVRDNPQQPGQVLAWSVDALPVRNAAGAVTAVCLLFTAPPEEGHAGPTGRIPDRLWALTKTLPTSRSLDDVIRLVMDEAVPTTGAVAAGLALLDEDRTLLKVLGASGYDAVTLHTWPTVPLTLPIPATTAVQEGRALFLTWSDVQEQFSQAATRPTYQGQAHVALPLMQEEVSLGCLTLSFPDRVPFTLAEQTVMGALAETCAQTITSLRLRDAERLARSESQRTAAYLDSVLERSPNGVAFLDVKLRFVRVNAPFAVFSRRGCRIIRERRGVRFCRTGSPYRRHSR
ncbi:GAF domain-containing protein [Deinococcus malanensis]|uniref:GAF domain-containing protein n=1 Tax=Deinococcus malanensis TaxID=1706855 RepID=UPI0036296089